MVSMLLKVIRKVPGLKRFLKLFVGERFFKKFLKKNPGVLRILELGQGVSLNKTSRRLCVFASYSTNAILHDYVLYYLKALHDLDFEIVFVSTNSSYQPSDIERLQPFVKLFIHRSNIGYDFGSYKAGLLYSGVNLSDYDQLLLTNDSCYGPLYPLKPIFDAMAKRKLDFWGIADNYEHAYHMMSYFLVFSRDTFLSEIFQSFWRELVMYPAHEKQRIIQQYEIGISRLLINDRRKFGAYCSYESIIQAKSLSNEVESPELLAERQTRYCASVHYFWREMILLGKFPFLKTDVVRKNPINARVLDWPRVVEQTSYPVKLIWDNLKLER